MLDFKHIIFDLDGTLINPEKGIMDSLSYTISIMNISFDLNSNFKEFIGPPLHEGFMDVLKLSESDADIAVKHFRDYYSRKGLYESTLYPGIYELLKNLNDNGIKLYLATSKLEKYAIAILKNLKLDKFFSFVSGAAYKGTGANKASLIGRVLQNIPSNEKSQTVMIGDTIFDIEGAQQTSIKSIGVLYGYSAVIELKNAGADYIEKDVVSLRKRLLKSF